MKYMNYTINDEDLLNKVTPELEEKIVALLVKNNLTIANVIYLFNQIMWRLSYEMEISDNRREYS